MRQAITTRYLGPTNARSSRVKATAAAGSIMFNWDHALGIDQNHAKAARALVQKLGWTGANGYAGVWVGGGLPNESGNVYVFTGEGFGGEGWPPGTAFEV